MRTSRTSKETAKVLQALSPSVRRQTRSTSLTTSALRSFTYDGESTVKTESISISAFRPTNESADDESSLSSADTADIEDLLEPPSKRRKRNATPVISSAANRTPRRPRQTIVKEEPEEKPSAPPKPRRMPARKTRDADGEIVVEPPSNWEIMYDTVKKMRLDNPTAPVDTMGCSELYWRVS